jgi:tagatose-1,6-bisphosphate aldolase
MKTVSNSRGVIAAAAVDQRGGWQKQVTEQPQDDRNDKKQLAARPSDRDFPLIFLSVMIMIFMLLVASSMMSWFSHDKDLLSKQTDALLAMAKYGFAAIIGLLAGWKLRK